MAATFGEDRVLLTCYLTTAARRSEMFKFKWEDMNSGNREIRLWTQKTRNGSLEGEWLPMNETLQSELTWWWDNRTFKDCAHVLIDYRPGAHYAKPYKVRRRFLAGLCDRASVKPFGFHSLRRFVASMLADRHKLSSKTVQRILRHKNVRTTELYLQNINQDLREVVDLLNLADERKAESRDAEAEG